MIHLLSEIQRDLGVISLDIKRGHLEDAGQQVHYLHAYIEARKQDFPVTEPAEEEVLA